MILADGDVIKLDTIAELNVHEALKALSFKMDLND